MNRHHLQTPSLIFLISICAWLGQSPQAAAQTLRLHCDGVNAIGGVFAAENGKMLAAGGQPHPLGPSSSSNHVVRPGFIYCLFGEAGCAGAAVARIAYSTMPTIGRQFQTRLMIDVSRVSAPHDLLGSFTGSLNWNPALLAYVSHSGLTSGFTGAINTAHASTGRLEFNGANAAGANGDIGILGIVFEVIGTAGANGTFDLHYTDMLAAGTFTNLLPCLTVNDAPFTIAPASDCLVCGDVNKDGTAGSSDALIILSYDVGIPIPAELLQSIEAGCGDVNSDGATGSSDALIILSYDAGLPVPFPVGTAGGCGTYRHVPATPQRHARLREIGGSNNEN